MSLKVQDAKLRVIFQRDIKETPVGTEIKQFRIVYRINTVHKRQRGHIDDVYGVAVAAGGVNAGPVRIECKMTRAGSRADAGDDLITPTVQHRNLIVFLAADEQITRVASASRGRHDHREGGRG